MLISITIINILEIRKQQEEGATTAANVYFVKLQLLKTHLGHTQATVSSRIFVSNLLQNITYLSIIGCVAHSTNGLSQATKYLISYVDQHVIYMLHKRFKKSKK